MRCQRNRCRWVAGGLPEAAPGTPNRDRAIEKEIGWLIPTTPDLFSFSPPLEERERERESPRYTQFFFCTLHLTASSKMAKFQVGTRFSQISCRYSLYT